MEKISIKTPPPNGIGREKLIGVVDIPIVHELYDTYKLLHTAILKFPKSERYSLGQICSSNLLSILESVLAASNYKEKERKLKKLIEASVRLDVLRITVRLSKDCDCMENNVYLELQSRLHTIGKMLGGWIKSAT